MTRTCFGFQGVEFVNWTPIDVKEGRNIFSRGAYKVAAFAQPYLQAVLNFWIAGMIIGDALVKKLSERICGLIVYDRNS